MNAVFTILIVLIIIAAILLIIAVLLQNGKGDGLASNFVAANQTFGVRQTADLLEKITWGLVTFILVAAIVSSFTLTTGGSVNDNLDSKIENTQEAKQPDFQTKPAATAEPAAEAVPAAEETK